jgi:AbrB family looped-hinge helix DNA binding protein
MVIKDREFTVSLSSKGQLTLPAEIRQLLSLEQGTRLRIRVRDDGTIELKKPTFTTIAELAGIGQRFQQSLAETLDDEAAALDADYAERWLAKQERSR